MDYRTKKQLALIWLKVKLVISIVLVTAGVSVGVYHFTGWGVWPSIAIAAAMAIFLQCCEDHPDTERDREILKYPVSGITDSRYPKKRRLGD